VVGMKVGAIVGLSDVGEALGMIDGVSDGDLDGVSLLGDIVGVRLGLSVVGM